MKKIILSFLFAIVINFSAKSQTTETEYNYITKGLLDDQEKGKDIKAGYKLVVALPESKIDWSDNTWRSATIYYFQKKQDNKNVAFAIECKDNKTRRFMCIPLASSSADLWKRAYNEFSTTGADWSLVFFWAFAKLSSSKLL